MAQFTVTAVDTTGIQPYIFGSNRLRENIGASELVRLATGQWALEAVAAKEVSDTKHNVTDTVAIKFNDDFRIEEMSDPQAAEVIYAGGGNIVIIFRSDATARAFAQHLTRKVLEKAPGLSLVIAHDHCEWRKPSQDNDSALSKVVQDLIHHKLAERKAARLPSLPMFGLSVTAECEATGLVAVQTNEGRYHDIRLKSNEEPTRLISRETRAKLVASEGANTHLKETLLDEEQARWFAFPSSIDELGRVKGEESYLAVVHADGNAMGNHIKDIAQAYPKSENNRCYIKAIRSFSEDLQCAATNALHHIVRLLTRAVRWDPESGQYLIANAIPVKNGRLLPFRPLVFGGDDVTFICNAQIGLALAAAYLEAFERETEKLRKKKLYACAGIAMVKMHYPFARAYELSEDLTRSAKALVREKCGAAKNASALDWHFATGGLSGSLAEIRRREYRVADGDLQMRPLLLYPEKNDQDGRAWFKRIESLIRTFTDDDAWKQKRNKVKALREALRQGPDEVKKFCRAYELTELPRAMQVQSDYQQEGWHGGRSVYFDAIELMDHYVSLEEAL